MKDQATSANRGTVVSVRGSVVDVRFDEHLPPIYSVLRAGADKQIVIEVLAPLERGGKAGLFGGAGVGKTVLETRFLTLLGFALGVSLGMWRLIAMTKNKRNDIK